MADILEGFAQLRTLRKQKSLSQTELGKLVGLYYTQIGRFECGTSRPSSDTLKRLADALDVSSDYLLEGSTEEAPRPDLKIGSCCGSFRKWSTCRKKTKWASSSCWMPS